MTASITTRNENIKRRTKVKTGCATCRVRKIKCDEQKPYCRKCVSTGRTCDGYESTFRSFTTPSDKTAHAVILNANIGLRATQPPFVEITPQDVDLLNRYFSTKTMFDVELGCVQEARQVLQASLTDPSIRHAVSSLRALREDLETSGDGPRAVAHQTPSYRYGLQQYNTALRGLAFKLSSTTSHGLKSALLCCQIFISIEQLRKNYGAMAQHIIRGLGIMREYRARPCLVDADRMVPAYHDQLPLLDIFLIKMFAAPCKFMERSFPSNVSESASPVYMPGLPEQPIDSRNLRVIAPNMRTELTRTAMSTLAFLDKVSQIQSIEGALALRTEKAALLKSLQVWVTDIKMAEIETGPSGHESVSVSFLRLFHLILKLVLLGTLDSSSAFRVELQTESDRLQEIADDLSERLKAYVICNGTNNRTNSE